VESGSASQLIATVLGTVPYTVELRRERTTIHASCSCPYFETDMCKHIWAVLLAADARQLLRGDSGDARPSLVMPDPDAAYGTFDDALDAGVLRPPAAEWRRRLAMLSPTAQPDAFSPGPDWPSTRELLYVIDVARSSARHGIQLEVARRDLKRDGTPGKPRAHGLPRDLPDRLIDTAGPRPNPCCPRSAARDAAGCG
jgi:hypothetical protein